MFIFGGGVGQDEGYKVTQPFRFATPYRINVPFERAKLHRRQIYGLFVGCVCVYG